MVEGRIFLNRVMTAVFFAVLCLASRAAMAAPEAPVLPEPEGILPPVFRDVLIILCIVLGVLLLVVVAYLWTVQHQAKEHVEQLQRLTGDVKAVTMELRTLRSILMPEQGGMDERGKKAEEDPKSVLSFPEEEGNAPPPVKRSIWQPFLEDFNSLARSMDIPKADIACENFVELHQLILLRCLFPSSPSGNRGEMPPKFTKEKAIANGVYWAWPLPEEEGRFAVVPRPNLSYDEKLYREGGLKETFASNFENGGPGAVYRHVEVKLPAIFVNKNGNWQIEQPGLIRLEP